MSTDRDVTRIVRSWLDEGVTALPDRVLDAVLDQIPATPQHRASWLVRRFPPMNNNIVRVGIAAAAVVIAAILVIRFLPGGNIGQNAEATPTPVPTPVPTASPSPRPIPGADAAGRATLHPGTYVAGDPFSLRLTLTVPAGWQGFIGGPYLVDLQWVGQPGGISFQIFDAVSADPCHPEQGFLNPPPGPSVDDLATVLANMPGVKVTDLSDVSVDGYSGKQLTISAPDSFAGCTLSSDGYVIWQLPLGSTHGMYSGERDRVWILDVAGKRLVIVVSADPAYTDQQRAELQAIFDSIRIKPAN
jgi:hypothetical protein